jgi:hypothetical protein
VTAVDPPANIPDMAMVTLDPLGQLRGFTRLLPSSPTSQATSAPATDWATIFREAGLDMSAFVRVEPDHTPRVPYDSRLAWRQSSGTTDLRVAAATLNMHPVQFGVGTSGADDVSESRPRLSGGSAAVDLAIWLLILSVFTGSAVLARYNLRLGQGDRHGARRLGMFVVGGGALSVILRPHHVPIPVEEITYLFAATGWALAWGGLTWLVYVGIEPYLRRLWPRTLISWNRLISGRVRDPLVGRDVLIGMLAGTIRLLLVLVPIDERAATAYSAATLESLQGVPQFLNVVLPFQIGYALAGGFAGAFVLLMLRLVVGRTWIAVVLTILLAIPLSGVSLGWMVIFVLAAPLITLIVFLRVGLLAYIATFYVDVLLRVPMTLDPNAWFFGHSLVVLLILGALASYAFVVSLGGRRAFGASPA